MTGPVRIQLRRTAGWRKPENAVKVDRTTHWGNPWVPDNRNAFRCPDMPEPPHLWLPARFYTGRGRMTPAEAVASFRRWLTHDWIDYDDLPPRDVIDPEMHLWLRRDQILSSLPELRGRDLACWCPLDRPCHADVLLELANA